MTGVEVLSAKQWRELWDDPVYRAKRESEAIQRDDFCPSCFEAPCAACDPQIVVVDYVLNTATRTWKRVMRGMAS